jgi:Translation initiation factor 2B subunit, eIF-2B alpha/beta/delta family
LKPEIRAAIKDIQANHECGARQLALTALQALRSVYADGTCDGEELRAICRQLAFARPMNAAIENAVASAWSRFLETNDCLRAVDETVEEIETGPEEMALAARKVIPSGTIMTHSWSSTVIELLSRIKPRRVIVSEARPFNEGIRVAKELVRAGVSTTLITEAQMALFVHEADAVVVGADTILPEGDFINKIGTRGLALAAKDADVPFYSVAETLKVSAPSEPLPFSAQEGKAAEICGEKWLEVRNVYYEVTPARLVTSYVTEHGVLDPADVQRFAIEAEHRWQALMSPHEM